MWKQYFDKEHSKEPDLEHPRKHLIITSALNSTEFALSSDDLAVRLAEYERCFFHCLKFKDEFDTINIIECIEKNNKIKEFEDTGIPVYYSELDNNKNKGMNEFDHIWNFIKQDFIGEEDIIIKLTGRYIMINTKILSYFNDNNIDFVGKRSDDIYPSANGIHGFLYGFRKKYYRKIYDPNINANAHYEILLFNFASSNPDNTIIITNGKIGVSTSIWIPAGCNSPKPTNFLKLYL